MKNYWLLWSWLVAFAFFHASAVTSGKESKILSPERYGAFMESLNIVKPDQTVPEKLARFSGIWLGVFRKEPKDTGEPVQWWHLIDHILVVEEIRIPRVMVVYAFQMPGLPGSPNELHWTRLKGEFINGTLRIAQGLAGDYVHVSTYSMEEDGNLYGIRADSSGVYRATLVQWRPK